MEIFIFFSSGGFVGEEYRCSYGHLQAKKMEGCEEPMLFSSSSSHLVDVKPERSETGYVYGHGNEEYQAVRPPWGQVLPASSPKSCVTGLSSNILDFSSSKVEGRQPQPDLSSEVRKMGVKFHHFSGINQPPHSSISSWAKRFHDFLCLMVLN